MGLLLNHRHSERLKGVEESPVGVALAIASRDSSTSFDYAQDRLLRLLGMTHHGEREMDADSRWFSWRRSSPGRSWARVGIGRVAFRANLHYTCDKRGMSNEQ